MKHKANEDMLKNRGHCFETYDQLDSVCLQENKDSRNNEYDGLKECCAPPARNRGIVNKNYR